MGSAVRLAGYFAGGLFSGQELIGNRALAGEIERVSRGMIRIDLPQDMATQEEGRDRAIRAEDYLAMIERDFVLANMNGLELDSGTVAEYMVASMLGMPRVQFRSDFRNVSDVGKRFGDSVTVRKTTSVPFNLMFCHDESATVFVNSIELYKKSNSDPRAFQRKLAVHAVRGIQLALGKTKTCKPDEYESWELPLVRNLNLDRAKVRPILREKKRRHLKPEYQRAVAKILELKLS
ncbi:MAG: nucleoside 2-deoxyribosyltransferase [Tepidisphaeraceae bacterium]|jgi:nucleoside 2-deoxyribosyltransferase